MHSENALQQKIIFPFTQSNETIFILNEAREKYNNEISMLEKKKQSYLSMNNEVDYKTNINAFFKKIHDVILDDDESVFKVFGSILDLSLIHI